MPLTCRGEVGSPGEAVDLGEVDGCWSGELGPREDGRGLFEDFILGGVVEVGVGEGEDGRDMLTISSRLKGRTQTHASLDVQAESLGRVARRVDGRPLTLTLCL